MQWDEPIANTVHLVAGEGFTLEGPAFFAPPVTFLRWQSLDEGGILALDESNGVPPEPFDVIGADGRPCENTEDGFQWHGDQPGQVKVCWAGNREAIIPVIGKDGRVAGPPLPPREVGELWDELVGFPEPPGTDEDPLPLPAPPPPPEGTSTHPNRPRPSTKTLIRSSMDLVEKIAGRQSQLKEGSWVAWCTRLEQTLLRAAKTQSVKKIRDLKVNPLSPLRNDAFRPAFAKAAAGKPSEFSVLYDEALDRIEAAWGVGDLRQLGDD
jgi:hypothetical protein